MFGLRWSHRQVGIALLEPPADWLARPGTIPRRAGRFRHRIVENQVPGDGGVTPRASWSAATAALWALGWAVTTAGGISVDEQFVVFGAYGAISSTFLQSTIIGAFIPKATAQVTS